MIFRFLPFFNKFITGFGIEPATTAALIGGGISLASALFGRKKKSSGGGSSAFDLQRIPGRTFTGERPFTSAGIGLPPELLQSLSKQFSGQLLRRSQGEGLVGFDPRRRKLLRDEFLADLEEQQANARRNALAQAASQGLRGGIPGIVLNRQVTRPFARERTRGLSAIDIQDLQARREDINRATFAQPQLVQQGASTQAARGAFDLDVFNAEAPTFLAAPKPTGGLSSLASAFGGLLGQVPFGQQRTPTRQSPNLSFRRPIQQAQNTLNDRLLSQLGRRF